MQFTFTMLEVLAGRPDGRATFDDLLQEMTSAEAQERAERFTELDGIDVLRAGLVVEEHETLRITEAGRSVLRAVEAFSIYAPGAEPLDQSGSLEQINDLVETEMREKVFNLGLRKRGDGAEFEAADNEVEIEQDETRSELKIDHKGRARPSDHVAVEPDATDTPEHARFERAIAPIAKTLPSFLKREGSNPESRVPSRSRPFGTFSAIAFNLKRLGGILRGHVEYDIPNVKAGVSGGGVGGLVLAILALLVVIICSGTFIAVNQIKSLKSEIATLEKKLPPLKQKPTSKQQEKGTIAEQRSTPSAEPTATGKPAGENQSVSKALVLSPEEVRQIRDYIKPAPFAGAAPKPISLGDQVTIGTIPLPSALTDKIPKLLGGRFTIYNGAIIILKRDSHHADAILGPN